MENKITKHLEANGLDLEFARERVLDFDWQIKAIFEAGEEYRESATAGALVEAVAQLWADLCLVGLHETTDPYSLYSLAIQEEEVA